MKAGIMSRKVTITRTWTLELEDDESLVDLALRGVTHIPTSNKLKSERSDALAGFTIARHVDFQASSRVTDCGTTVSIDTVDGRNIGTTSDPSAAANLD